MFPQLSHFLQKRYEANFVHKHYFQLENQPFLCTSKNLPKSTVYLLSLVIFLFAKQTQIIQKVKQSDIGKQCSNLKFSKFPIHICSYVSSLTFIFNQHLSLSFLFLSFTHIDKHLYISKWTLIASVFWRIGRIIIFNLYLELKILLQ